MKTGRRVAAVWTGMLAAGLMAPTLLAAQERVTLDEAIERALGRSPQLAQQEQAVENAALAQRQAWAAFLPTLTGSTSGSLRSSRVLDPNTGEIRAGSSDSYSAGISARVDVFRGGARFVEMDRADADYRAAEAQRESQRFNVVLQTKSLFFAALRQDELLEVARRRVEQAQQNMEIVRARRRVGQATVSDSLRARLDLVNAQQSLLEAETELRAARFALGRQIGERGPVAAVPPDDLDPRPLGLSDEEILTLAEEASPAVQAAAYSAAAAAAQVTAAKTQYLPSISVNSGYSWNNQQRSFRGGTTSWTVGINLSYPIFNQFQRESNVDRAQFQHRLATLQEEDARLAARQEADAALHDLRTAEQRIANAREAVLVAAEDLRVVRERYSVGAATILDVLVSQAAADQADADLVSARFDYLLARAQLEAILGRELEG